MFHIAAGKATPLPVPDDADTVRFIRKDKELLVRRLHPPSKIAGFMLFYASNGASLALEDIANGGQIQSVSGSVLPVTNYCISDHCLVASHGTNDIWVWDIATGKKLISFPGRRPLPDNGQELPAALDALQLFETSQGKLAQVNLLTGVLTSFEGAGSSFTLFTRIPKGAADNVEEDETSALLRGQQKDGRLAIWRRTDGKRLAVLPLASALNASHGKWNRWRLKKDCRFLIADTASRAVDLRAKLVLSVPSKLSSQKLRRIEDDTQRYLQSSDPPSDLPPAP